VLSKTGEGIALSCLLSITYISQTKVRDFVE